MKLLRLWLLVLLAVLLPVRGAMAAAMLCPLGGSGSHSEMPLMDHAAAGHAHDEGSQPQLQHRHQHQHHDMSQHDHGSSSQDRCNLCSAFCSLTPMLSAFAGIAEPHGLVEVPFPALSAPAASFLSDGQERPPRST